MTDAEHTHYFARRPSVPSQPRIVEAEVRGHRLSFVTDRGVFSYGRVDPGSRLLAEKMDLPPEGDLLDWGCAWGLLGIVAARTWPGEAPARDSLASSPDCGTTGTAGDSP